MGHRYATEWIAPWYLEMMVPVRHVSLSIFSFTEKKNRMPKSGSDEKRTSLQIFSKLFSHVIPLLFSNSLKYNIIIK